MGTVRHETGQDETGGDKGPMIFKWIYAEGLIEAFKTIILYKLFFMFCYLHIQLAYFMTAENQSPRLGKKQYDKYILFEIQIAGHHSNGKEHQPAS